MPDADGNVGQTESAPAPDTEKSGVSAGIIALIAVVCVAIVAVIAAVIAKNKKKN
ncbi:MAG: hypothetical protein K2K87_01540 [Lachnospiraceae bacterium]|nr:hypothetical protein [Lachnospiraceae bacterium]